MLVHQRPDLLHLVERHEFAPVDVILFGEFGVEVVRMERERIKESIGAGGVHRLDEVHGIHGGVTPCQRGTDDGADHGDVGIDRFERAVGRLQQVGVFDRIDRVPEERGIRFVPHFVRGDLVAITLRHRGREVGEILYIRGVPVTRRPLGRPVRGPLQDTEDAHPATIGLRDDLIELGPVQVEIPVDRPAHRIGGLHKNPRHQQSDVLDPERLHEVQVFDHVVETVGEVDIRIRDTDRRRRFVDRRDLHDLVGQHRCAFGNSEMPSRCRHQCRRCQTGNKTSGNAAYQLRRKLPHMITQFSRFGVNPAGFDNARKLAELRSK